ncbi:MAG: glycosyltransferase [Rhodanobacter sp.]
MTRLLTAGAGGVLWSHSYLAATGMNRINAPVNVVDFANIESERFRSFAAHSRSISSRCSMRLESAKAQKWEPRIAANADLSLAITDHDYRWLADRGARTVLARNGLDTGIEPLPSPTNGTVVAVGNWDYAPNRDGLRRFIINTWPAIHRAVGWARIEIAGVGGGRFVHLAKDSSVTALGFVPDLAPVYARAAAVLAPAQSGGGSQLKVAEAWGHGRIVIGPLHLLREARSGLPDGALLATADLAAAVERTLVNSSVRHKVELDLIRFVAQKTWKNELSEMVARVGSLIQGVSPTLG